MERFDLIVVGGGISGLGLAAYGRTLGLHPCVLEADRRVGGALRSHSLGDDFWIELGAHTVYNSYGRLAGLLEDTGLLERLLPRVKAAVDALGGRPAPRYSWAAPQAGTAALPAPDVAGETGGTQRGGILLPGARADLQDGRDLNS